MKKILFALLTISIVSVSIISCTKNDDALPTTNYTYITSKPWILKSEWAKAAIDSPWKVIDTALPICYRDNITTFSTNNRFSVDEGKVFCDTTKYASSVVLSGTWSLQNNQTTLVTGSSYGSQTFAIEVLNSSYLQVSYNDATGYYRELYMH